MCPLEPEEVEELRCANDYPPNTFRKVLDSVRQAFPSGRYVRRNRACAITYTTAIIRYNYVLICGRRVFIQYI